MKKIAILIETSLASGRQILMGVSRYLDERPDWTVFQHVGQLGAMDRGAIKDWQGDGIIARIADEGTQNLMKEKNLPVIDILGNVKPQLFPLVKCNDVAVGQTVARHFVDNGQRSLAFIGLSNEYWSLDREKGFSEVASDCKASFERFHLKQGQLSYSGTKSDFEEIKAWVSSLAKPVGLMVSSDQLAPMVFEACRQLNLAIPEQVSVVGVDNDAPFTSLCRPRLSSLEPDHERVGYEAAKALGRLMDGGTLPEQVIEIDQMMLHQRLSSDRLVVEDESVAKALQFIRLNAVQSPGVNEVAKVAGVSLSVLQRRFRQILNRTVGEIVLNEKLNVARKMLRHTDLSLIQVAERSGFNCQEYMNHIFKQHLNTTPRKYRLGL